MKRGKQTAFQLLRRIQAANPGPRVKRSVLPGRPGDEDQMQCILRITPEQVDAAVLRIAADKAVGRSTDRRIVSMAQLAEQDSVSYQGITLKRTS